MASYASISDIKAVDRLNITDTTSDIVLTDVVEAVSRWIDDISASAGLLLYTDDDGDGVFENTWAATDYNLRPYNPKSGWPFEAIEITTNGDFYFPSTKRGVKITAAFGWPSIPAQVKQACILQSERLFKRFATPLGSSGMSALGEIRLSIPSADGDVTALLEPFMRVIE